MIYLNAVIALLLFVYLFAAMIRPERFRLAGWQGKIW
jgi:K+-transporting ATPase KdpF subunit